MSTIRTLPTWEELYTWACSKADDESVGRMALFYACPIATYQQEKYHEEWKIGAFSAFPRRKATEIILKPEDWHVQVITLVDDLPGAMTLHSDIVTAGQFKTILEQVKPTSRGGTL